MTMVLVLENHRYTCELVPQRRAAGEERSDSAQVRTHSVLLHVIVLLLYNGSAVLRAAESRAAVWFAP